MNKFDFKHSPGEWYWAHNGMYTGSIKSTERTPGSNCIAEVHGRDDEKEFVANCRLIAMASEMLELIYDFPGHCDEKSWNEWVFKRDGILNRAKGDK